MPLDPRVGSMMSSNGFKPACVLHDRVNLLVLPVLSCLAVCGALGVMDTGFITKAFLGYIVADFFWVLFQPDALPSQPAVILGHHIVTIVLLLFPLRHPTHGMSTCLDGLTEINTFFLIARRQVPSLRPILTYFYWATFFPLRCMLYPYLMFRFWDMTGGHPLWERVQVVGCQFLLVCFNGFMLYLSFKSWARKNRKQYRSGLSQFKQLHDSALELCGVGSSSRWYGWYTTDPPTPSQAALDQTGSLPDGKVANGKLENGNHANGRQTIACDARQKQL